MQPTPTGADKKPQIHSHYTSAVQQCKFHPGHPLCTSGRRGGGAAGQRLGHAAQPRGPRRAHPWYACEGSNKTAAATHCAEPPLPPPSAYV